MVERIMDPNNIRGDHLNRYNFACKTIKSAKNILDIGCGIGYGSVIMHNLLDAQIDCIDKSTEAYEVFQEAYNFTAPCIDYIVADFTKLDKNRLKKSYDAVVSFEFIEHIPPKLVPKVFELAAEKSNTFICSSPNEWVRPHKQPPVNEFHFKHYDPDEFSDFACDAGFTDLEFYCQTRGDYGDVRPGQDGKFMIGVFKK